MNYESAYKQLAAKVREMAAVAIRERSQILLAGAVLSGVALIEEHEAQIEADEPITADGICNMLMARNAEAAAKYAREGGK